MSESPPSGRKSFCRNLQTIDWVSERSRRPRELTRLPLQRRQKAAIVFHDTLSCRCCLTDFHIFSFFCFMSLPHTTAVLSFFNFSPSNCFSFLSDFSYLASTFVQLLLCVSKETKWEMREWKGQRGSRRLCAVAPLSLVLFLSKCQNMFCWVWAQNDFLSFFLFSFYLSFFLLCFFLSFFLFSIFHLVIGESCVENCGKNYNIILIYFRNYHMM